MNIDSKLNNASDFLKREFKVPQLSDLGVEHPSPSLDLLFGTMFHMAHHSSTNRHFNEWTFMQLSFME
ncbi:hypothetical protein MKX03_005202 [Papaver bracteatum]|nr:hypothetical protein MKX03_005202 [Papaver bracteatum]